MKAETVAKSVVESPRSVYLTGVGLGLGCGALVLALLLGLLSL